jgi:hypothetical protein
LMRCLLLVVLSSLLASCGSSQATLRSPAVSKTSPPWIAVTAGVTLDCEGACAGDVRTETVEATMPPPDVPMQQTAVPNCDAARTFCILDGHFDFKRPIAPPGKYTADLSYLFGSTQNNQRQPHHGIDLINPTGTSVFAAADGEIVFAGNDKEDPVSPWADLYGNVIIIEHRFDGISRPVYSLYGHLSSVKGMEGETVRAGDLIGAVGATGAAIGSHLHFEVRYDKNTYGSSSNPQLWLIPLTGRGVLAGRVVDRQGNFIHLVNLKVQYYPQGSKSPTMAYQLETYASEAESVHRDEQLQENFALGDLPSGNYRLTFISANKLYERWVDVEPGKLTFTEFVVK